MDFVSASQSYDAEARSRRLFCLGFADYAAKSQVRYPRGEYLGEKEVGELWN